MESSNDLVYEIHPGPRCAAVDCCHNDILNRTIRLGNDLPPYHEGCDCRGVKVGRVLEGPADDGLIKVVTLT